MNITRIHDEAGSFGPHALVDGPTLNSRIFMDPTWKVLVFPTWVFFLKEVRERKQQKRAHLQTECPFLLPLMVLGPVGKSSR